MNQNLKKFEKGTKLLHYTFLIFALLLVSCKPRGSLLKESYPSSAPEVSIDPQLRELLLASGADEDQVRETIQQIVRASQMKAGILSQPVYWLGPGVVMDQAMVSLEQIQGLKQRVWQNVKRKATGYGLLATGAVLMVIPAGFTQGIGTFLFASATALIGGAVVVYRAGEGLKDTITVQKMEIKSLADAEDKLKKGLNLLLSNNRSSRMIGQVTKVSLDAKWGISGFETNEDFYFKSKSSSQLQGSYFVSYRPKALFNPQNASDQIIDFLIGKLVPEDKYIRKRAYLDEVFSTQETRLDINRAELENRLEIAREILLEARIVHGRYRVGLSNQDAEREWIDNVSSGFEKSLNNLARKIAEWKPKFFHPDLLKEVKEVSADIAMLQSHCVQKLFAIEQKEI